MQCPPRSRHKQPVVVLPETVDDAIACLPALELLVRHRLAPRCLCNPAMLPLLAGAIPDVKPRKTGLLGCWRQLRQHGDGLVIDLSSRPIHPLLRPQGRRYLHITTTSRRQPFAMRAHHLAVRAIEIMTGHPVFTDRPGVSRLQPTPAHCHQALAYLYEHRLWPGHFTLWQPLDRYGTPWPDMRSFADHRHRAGEILVCCPSPGQELACAHLLPHARHLPAIELETAAALCQLARAVLAGDSPLLHIACACNPKTLGLLGPASGDSQRPWLGRCLGDATGWPDRMTVASHWRRLVGGRTTTGRAAQPLIIDEDGMPNRSISNAPEAGEACSPSLASPHESAKSVLVLR